MVANISLTNPSLMFRFVLVTLFIFSNSCFAQNKKPVADLKNPRTILWKISGKDCKQPSYLLGTMHVIKGDWAYAFPEIKHAIDSTEFLLSEAFTTSPTVEKIPKNKRLRAISILTSEQYKTLDSFFVARVDDGIKNNPEAEEMTIAEMRSAILLTLVVNKSGANGITEFMDLDIFKLFLKNGRKADMLDRVPTVDFDSSSIENAKRFFSGTIASIKGSDKPDWNIYHNDSLDKNIETYTQFKMDYKLEEEDSGIGEPYHEFDYVPLKVRNRNWIPKIEKNISEKSCLIAVGFGHLKYKTGVISLLRERGYTVEPVPLTIIK